MDLEWLRPLCLTPPYRLLSRSKERLNFFAQTLRNAALNLHSLPRGRLHWPAVQYPGDIADQGLPTARSVPGCRFSDRILNYGCIVWAVLGFTK